MSNIVEVEIKISDLLNDLNSGLQWLGATNSIQAKYGMQEEDVEAIRQHPALQPVRVFKIVDDVTIKPAAPVAAEPELPFTEEVATNHAIENFEAEALAIDASEEDSSLDFMSL